MYITQPATSYKNSVSVMKGKFPGHLCPNRDINKNSCFLFRKVYYTQLLTSEDEAFRLLEVRQVDPIYLCQKKNYMTNYFTFSPQWHPLAELPRIMKSLDFVIQDKIEGLLNDPEGDKSF